MSTPTRLRIVYLEDDESGFELVRSLGAAEGIEFELIHAFDEESYRAALAPVVPDVILSDYNLPTIDGVTALALRGELCPATPFIFVSGALGEAAAIDLLKTGATDFVLKDSLPRLFPSIRRALAEANERRERLHAEESLRESEERFRRLAENAPDVIFRYRMEATGMRCEYISAAVERISGYRPQEFYADRRMIIRVAHPDDQSTLLGMLVSRKIPEGMKEIRWIARDGRTIVTEQRFVPVYDEAGKLIAMEGIARDVTAVKEEAERRRAVDVRLNQAQKMESIGVLAGGIAHDFNNILTGILGFTELAEVTLEPENPALSSLAEVRKAGLRARDLVSQILTFSRQSEAEQVPLDLARVVGEALSFLRASTPATIAIEQELTPCTVCADPTQLHQVLLNLGTNAAHAMLARPGRLRIAVAPVEVDAAVAAAMPKLVPGPHACLTVQDTGHGMDAATLARIFDPYFTTKPAGEGTGLGLGVVQNIVAAHRGGITVASTPGVGTTFRVYLPISTQTESTLPVYSPVPPGRGERILVVDDETTIGAFTGGRLEQFNYQPTVFSDPVRALAAVKAEPARFAAIVTDLSMPGSNGLELLRDIRALAGEIPAIIVTGNRNALPRTEELPGRLALLDKPFSGDDLARTLHRLLAPGDSETLKN